MSHTSQGSDLPVFSGALLSHAPSPSSVLLQCLQSTHTCKLLIIAFGPS